MTLYVVQAPGSDPAALQRARFVRQGFSWGAFFLTWLWLLYRRCWIAALAWVILQAAFIFIVVPHLAPGAALAVDLLARLFLALEGSHLRLKRRAAVTDLIEARDQDEAEMIFFRRALGEGAAGAATS